MADSNATEEKSKDLDDVEANYENGELDDSNAKFINGGKGLDDQTAIVPRSRSSDVFTGLGKDELKIYANDPFWVRLRWILFILFWVGWLAMLVSAIVIIVLAPRCPTRPDLKWYHSDVAYNVYHKSFFDKSKDQDGVGDLEGIIEKEGYIEGLGAKVIWLSSIFKMDSTDEGVIDYLALDEKFGTLENFRSFLRRMMKLGKKVIMDFIPNHTSKLHDWFNKSRKGEAGFEDFYVWSNTKNNWTDKDGKSKWTMDDQRKQFYLHQFSETTADLNLSSPGVREEFKKILAFWADVGISGFHIVGAEYLTENTSFIDEDSQTNSQTLHFPDNAEVINFFRTVVDSLDNKPGREKLLFATVMDATEDKLALYSGTEERKGMHMVSVVLDKFTDGMSVKNVTMMLKPYFPNSTSPWFGWRLSTPYTSRIGSHVSEKLLTVAHTLQALLPGTAQPYYGDEIAMKDGAIANEMKSRTPMQWSKEVNAGFTKGTPWLPVNSDYTQTNVDTLTAQLGDNSLMSSFKALMKLRTQESLQFGHTYFCSTLDLLIFARHAPGFPFYVVIINLSSKPTAHNFMGDFCTFGKVSAEVVFHSRNSDHVEKTLDLQLSISVNAGEVLVLKFSA